MAAGILGPIERVRTSKLNLYPGNARRGDIDAIAASLEAHGQFQPIIAQLDTDYVLVGNHTLKAARQLRWAEVDVAYVDVSDDKAKRIVLVANRTSDLGTYDLDALATLLTDLDSLDGTGYNDADLTGLLASEEEELSEDDEEPPARKTKLGVVVYCQSEDEQMQLLTTLLDEGRDARAL
jgi:ParB-like chromosome segregation protein Spo0J